jgi:hypothetical protein
LIPHIRKALARPGEDPAAASRSHVEKLPGWTRCSGFVVSTLVDGPGRLLSDSHDVFWNGRRGRSLESWRRSPIVVALIAVAGLAAASAAHAHLERPTTFPNPARGGVKPGAMSSSRPRTGLAPRGSSSETVSASPRSSTTAHCSSEVLPPLDIESCAAQTRLRMMSLVVGLKLSRRW